MATWALGRTPSPLGEDTSREHFLTHTQAGGTEGRRRCPATCASVAGPRSSRQPLFIFRFKILAVQAVG